MCQLCLAAAERMLHRSFTHCSTSSIEQYQTYMKGFVFEFICNEDRRLSIVHSVILQLKGCCIVHSHILACHELSRIENLNEGISSGSYGNPPCESKTSARPRAKAARKLWERSASRLSRESSRERRKQVIVETRFNIHICHHLGTIFRESKSERHQETNVVRKSKMCA